GRTLLEEVEQRGPMLAELVACVGALLADALAAAHAALIVHRDVKPSNVLVARGGRLLLADFGVARLETESSLVTRTGALLGTPAYMSPEQASGDIASARSDVCSLGATLYQLATGHLPYSVTAAKVISQIAAGTLVAPARRHAPVGPDLSQMIVQMMATEPSQRPTSAGAIASELRAYAQRSGLGEPTEELAAYFSDPHAFVAAKRPTIVRALLATADRAILEDKLPRAIALADRASVLAPDDPAVAALVEKVTEGGRSSRRRKVLAIVGAGVIATGGATAIAMSMRRASPPAVADAGAILITEDAAEVADAPDLVADATLDALVPDAAVAVRGRDASVARGRDATATVVIDAALQVDAAEPPDAADARGLLTVVNDTWCEVSIDGVEKGRITRSATYEVSAGPHVVVCRQPGIQRWEKRIEVVAGTPARVAGSMVGEVEVRFDVDAIIGGTAWSKGQTGKLKPGRTNAIVDGQSLWLDIPRVACRLQKEGPRLVCDP
ncbi:MAG TPA: serine/threonine-protein kinase, partial [Kofleriaceae bacterium]|nr:serine/threonine-protein kinase [Kofleriaceae bacterium]